MPELKQQQRAVIEQLFAQTPDAVLRRIEAALAMGGGEHGPMAEVRALANHALADRTVRAAVFGPTAGLFRVSPVREAPFPTRALERLWLALVVDRPDLVDRARALAADAGADPSRAVEVYNDLCAVAAAGLRAETGAYADARHAFGPEDADAFAGYLDLAPLARRCAQRLPDWMVRMSEDDAAGARLAYRDAAALASDGGPRFMELLLTQLDEPWRILKVMAAVVRKARDQYLADSELAPFGDRLLDEAERQIEAVRKFDPAPGREAGRAAARALNRSAQILGEFEADLELGRERGWGARIGKLRQTAADLVQTRFAEIEKAVDKALPLRHVRAGRGTKTVPKLTEEPNPETIARALGLLSLFEGCRACASKSGFGSARAKLEEWLTSRLEDYVEDLLEALRTEGEVPPALIRAYLDVAADLLADVSGETAAGLIRRRAAAA